MNKHKLFLIDAYALIYRSYFAFIKNPRLTSKGLNTSAIYGFVNTILELLIKEKPAYLGIGFDPPSPTFRHKTYPEYKAQRDETPEAIKIAVPYIKAFAEYMQIPIIQHPDYEADDVIGTIAKKMTGTDTVAFLVTSDKDFGQLVDDHIFLYKPKAFSSGYDIVGKEEICKKYGIDSPVQIIDILTLWGDTADNIPGINGIGEKTAAKLIAEYGSVEGVYENIDKIGGKLKENLLKGKDFIPKAKLLVTIETNVDLAISKEMLQVNQPHTSQLFALFEELEFRNLKQRFSEFLMPQKELFHPTLFDIPAETETNSDNPRKNIKSIDQRYTLINNYSDAKQWIEAISESSEICFDTETTSLSPYEARLVGIAVCVNPGEACFLLCTDLLSDVEIINLIKPFFESDKMLIIGQNLKYDILILMNYGLKCKAQLVDTMLAHYLLEPEQRHNLDYLALTYLNYEKITTESLIGKKNENQRSMNQVDPELLKDYACEDVDTTMQLWKIFKPKLEQQKLIDVFYKVECPLINVLAEMEYNGVCIDVERLQRLEIEYQSELENIENIIYKLAGLKFNINSTKQLGAVLFDHLKITDKPKLTKTKQYATGEDVLYELKNHHPIVSYILDYRELQKLLNTYIEALPKLINKTTGRIHTSFNQAVTATGRLSSTNPNLQNIPSKEERGKIIRKAFIPYSENSVIMSADYSQIELRIMAHFSQDQNLIDAFNSNRDIHRETAAKLFNVTPEEVTPQQRNQAKGANFGIIYGISSFGLAQNTGLSNKQAKMLIDNYFKSFPRVKEFMDQSIQFARENGYVKTILGRIRRLPDINSANAVVRGGAERNAINTPIQGSAADLIKVAMIKIHNEIKKHSLNAKLLLQVHDELVFDVPDNEIDQVRQIVEESMLNAIPLNVKLKVDINIGKNWYESH